MIHISLLQLFQKQSGGFLSEILTIKYIQLYFKLITDSDSLGFSGIF